MLQLWPIGPNQRYTLDPLSVQIFSNSNPNHEYCVRESNYNLMVQIICIPLNTKSKFLNNVLSKLKKKKKTNVNVYLETVLFLCIVFFFELYPMILYLLLYIFFLYIVDLFFMKIKIKFVVKLLSTIYLPAKINAFQQ